MNDSEKKLLLNLVEWCGMNFERDSREKWLTGRQASPMIDGVKLLDEICSKGVTPEEIDAALMRGQDKRDEARRRQST